MADVPHRDSSSPARAWQRARIVPVVAALTAAAVACGALGWWQWERAREQAVTVDAAPTVPLAEVLQPGVSPGLALGRQVTVTGRWGSEDAAVVQGRDVDGESAVFLLRPLRVPAHATGTGQEATMTVLVGWSDGAEALPVVPDAPGDVTVSGYLRAGEASTANAALAPPGVERAFSTGSMAPSELAQVWEGPLYAAVLVSDQPDGEWLALPVPEPDTTLDFRSVAYAIEWWIFGAFFVFIGARWIRDNGRVPQRDPGSKEDVLHE